MLRVTPSHGEQFWRVEDSLVDQGAVQPLAFLARNAHRYSERWKRYVALIGLAFVRVFLYATSPVLSSRVLHLMLRGMSRDRLDLLGEEYFEVYLRPRLKRAGVEALRRALAEPQGAGIVLVSQGLEHVVRPLARHLGVARFLANRLDFRDGIATGRLHRPVVHSRGGIARLASRDPAGPVSLEILSRNLGVAPATVRRAIQPAEPQATPRPHAAVHFPGAQPVEHLSVRRALAGKQVLLVGVTGFIGKVWFAKLLEDLPEIGRIHLLIRRRREASALRRFERLIEENPVFESLHVRYGDDLARFLGDRVEVHEGDVTLPGLGLDAATQARLQRDLDVVINSGGLTDFNPDLRQAMASNVEATLHLLDFVRGSERAALLHLSTCYVVGNRDGRILETLTPDYVPREGVAFDAEAERERLLQHVRAAEANARDRDPSWLRRVLTEAAAHRARELGWPNAYVFTKSLGESLLMKRGGDVPIAIVRPSIVETSLRQPFTGWNEGINTSAPLSYLLGTTFRQLPANERKCLDIIPVDVVCRGMTLIAAALVERCHEPLYQLATSVSRPCDMKRSIELTSLAHRKHYREQPGYRAFWKMRMDAIPVSKQRYERLSAPRHKAILARVRRFLSVLPFKLRMLSRAERAVSRIAKLVEVYEPFILHNEHVFEARNVERLSQALPADERAAFAYDLDALDWREYWIEIHIPAMRRWCYPLIEGRTVPLRPRGTFRLPARRLADPHRAGPGREAVGT